MLKKQLKIRKNTTTLSEAGLIGFTKYSTHKTVQILMYLQLQIKEKKLLEKRCFVIITKFQNMRCFCTSEGCNSKATYPQGCKIFVRLLIFSKIFLIQISNFKNQNIISHEGKRSREKRWNHSSCTFHNLDCTRILPSIKGFQHIWQLKKGNQHCAEDLTKFCENFNFHRFSHQAACLPVQLLAECL